MSDAHVYKVPTDWKARAHVDEEGYAAENREGKEPALVEDRPVTSARIRRRISSPKARRR